MQCMFSCFHVGFPLSQTKINNKNLSWGWLQMVYEGRWFYGIYGFQMVRSQSFFFTVSKFKWRENGRLLFALNGEKNGGVNYSFWLRITWATSHGRKSWRRYCLLHEHLFKLNKYSEINIQKNKTIIYRLFTNFFLFLKSKDIEKTISHFLETIKRFPISFEASSSYLASLI